ncbi:MAG: PEGA domain-containing protein [Deltaproteobacteria bacterium]|nr:PEGA domain-containing protein [Deltaproteobacteria bacterium]
MLGRIILDPIKKTLPLVLLLLAVVACQPQRPRARPVGGLQLDCTPQSAQIFVDDRYVGTVSRLAGNALTLSAGTHRIELRAEGYFASYHELRVVVGVRQKLQVTLRREPF